MARHNYISLLGSVLVAPKIKEDIEKKEKGLLILKVLKGDRNCFNEELTETIATPIVVTSDPLLIGKIKLLSENDIVLIKGNIVTKKEKKVVVCEHCGTRQGAEGLLTYINPISIVPVKRIDTKEDAQRYLSEYNEVSNEATLIGHLCSDPEKIASIKQTCAVQYKIGINRKYKINTDEVSETNLKADFPYVKSYGKNALDDLESLKKGSTVLIDGYLQSRKFKRKKECENPECGKNFDWVDSVLEIVTYQVEYLRNLKNKPNNKVDEDSNAVNMLHDNE